MAMGLLHLPGCFFPWLWPTAALKERCSQLFCFPAHITSSLGICFLRQLLLGDVASICQLKQGTSLALQISCSTKAKLWSSLPTLWWSQPRKPQSSLGTASPSLITCAQLSASYPPQGQTQRLFNSGKVNRWYELLSLQAPQVGLGSFPGWDSAGTGACLLFKGCNLILNFASRIRILDFSVFTGEETNFVTFPAWQKASTGGLKGGYSSSGHPVHQQLGHRQILLNKVQSFLHLRS